LRGQIVEDPVVLGGDAACVAGGADCGENLGFSDYEARRRAADLVHELARRVGGVGAGPDSTGSDGAEDDEWVVDLLLLARRGGARETRTSLKE